MPPKAIIFFFVFAASRLNFIGSKNLLFLLTLNNGVKKINFTPCCSFILISCTECAEPMIINFFLKLLLLKFIFLLNDGKYTPSRLSFIANFKLLDKKNFLPCF